MGISLGVNRYGKAECRLVHVDRSTPNHRLTDVTVTSQLLGDFADTHLTGDNGKIIATDTQKNTVYALARRHGVGAPEAFALRLARYFVAGFEQVHGAHQEVLAHGWDRIGDGTGGAPRDRAFVRGSAETRTAVVHKDAAGESVLSGLTDLVLLKTSDSEFHGFPDVPYTALVETDDRILATSVTARWRHLGTGPALDSPALDSTAWDDSFTAVRSLLLDTFADHHSLSLQQTLHAMGRAVLETHPDIAEIRFSMPNKHHFLVDLSAWGLDNPNEVWYAADRPYGRIEAAVVRDDVPPAPGAWEFVPGFV